MNSAIKLGTVAAVVVLVGVVGITMLPGTARTGVGAGAAASPSSSPGPSSSPSPSPASQGIPASGIGSAVVLPPGRLEAGRYHVKHHPQRGYGGNLGMWRVSFEVPAGWLGENERHALIRKGYGGSPSGLVMAVRRIGRAYSDPCHTVGAEARGDYVDFPDVTYSGTVLGHLDRALARLGEQWGDDASPPPSTGFAPDSPTATKATDTTIAGLAGRYVEVRTPADLDLSSCDGYQYVLWNDYPGDLPGRLYTASAGQVDRIWIVDLDGADPQTRGLLLVIAASSQPGASAEDLAELQAIVESIEIEYLSTGATPPSTGAPGPVPPAAGAPGASAGRIAFTRNTGDPDRGNRDDGSFDSDIYLITDDGLARRVIGSASESLDQVCPAFSADGTRLAFGQAEGTSEADAGYRNAALVIAELDADGNATPSQVVDIGGTFDPPCARWSPDGSRIAFRITTRLANGWPPGGREVGIVTLEDGQVTVLPDVLATDLEWSPDGSLLAIAQARADAVFTRGDEQLRVYSVLTGELTTLVGPVGVESLSWSPDGSRIAYQRLKDAGELSPEGGVLAGTRAQEIWVVRVDGNGQVLQTGAFEAIHGAGPVWSPAGDRIVYQRVCAANPASPALRCREQHEVVVLTPGTNGDASQPAGSEVVLAPVRAPGAAGPAFWFPFGVAWSPDGEQLLYLAWPEPLPGNDLMAPPASPFYSVALIAVPVDATLPPTLVYEGRDISGMSEQPWGRQPQE